MFSEGVESHVGLCPLNVSQSHTFPCMLTTKSSLTFYLIGSCFHVFRNEENVPSPHCVAGVTKARVMFRRQEYSGDRQGE